MGRSLNKVMVIGNLCRDPEVRYMPSGNAVANVSLATDESYNDKTTGQKVEQTEFHRITVYGKLAEIIQQYLKKGSPILVEGRLQMDEWKNQQGEKRSKLRVRADTVKFLGTSQKRDGLETAGPGNSSGAAPAASASSSAAAATPFGDEMGGGLAQDDEHLPF